MNGAVGDETDAALRLMFDSRLKLEFHGSKVTSDAGLLPFRDLDDALGLTDLAGEVLADTRTGQNSRHTLIAQLRQSVFGRLAGYEDVNDAAARASERSHWVEGVTWGARMEGAEQQKGRADRMQPSEQDLTEEVPSAVHGDLSRSWPSLITSGAALIPHSGQFPA